MSNVLLVVDDSEMARNYHAYILENQGFEVITAVDGMDGLDKLCRHKDIRMVITDINMPNLDGYTFVERIRAMPELQNLPVIMVSTEDQGQDKQKGFDAGANIYIVKPTEPDQLLANINLLLGSQED